MTEFVLIDEAVGETRACWFDEDGQPLELIIERISERSTRVLAGSAHIGRIARVDNSLNAAFVELPIGEAGFLPFGKKGRPADVHEGAKLPVMVSREALPGKGPNLRLCAEEQLGAGPLSVLDRMNLPAEIEVFDVDRSGREKIDHAIDQALAKRVCIIGGGDICIEPTRALVAIDVDTGVSPITGGRFNYKAAQSAFRQLRLRSLGGIIVIDFAPMASKNERNALFASVTSLAKKDPARVDVLPLSRFGTLEMLRRKNTRSPSDIMLGANGKKTIETIALEALRSLENEAQASAGAKLELQAGASVFEWLDQDHIGWQAEMANRIGSRFYLFLNESSGRLQWEVVVK